MEDKVTDLNEIKKLTSQMLNYMSRFELQRIKLKSGQFELELEKAISSPQLYAHDMALAPARPPIIPSVIPSVAPSSSRVESLEGHLVTAPIVGTFYTSSDPTSAAFVKKGDRVEENSVVCIIEAMKVMNEIRAGKSGIVAEIYVENGHPVEFGTKMMRII